MTAFTTLACALLLTLPAAHSLSLGKEGALSYGQHGADWTMGECLGAEQSPIDLKAGLAPVSGWRLSDHSGMGNGSLENNGHALQFDAPNGKTLSVEDGDFAMAQFHFHSPSEHTVDGRRFPLEMHMVYKPQPQGRHSVRNKVAVIGIFFQSSGYASSISLRASVVTKSGARQRFVQAATLGDGSGTATNGVGSGSDPFLESLIRTHSGSDVQVDGMSVQSNVDWDALELGGQYFKYNGSLTTPNCSEQVAWHILASPKSASDSQIEFFKKAFWGNYREIKQLNGRELLLVNPNSSFSNISLTSSL